MLKNNVKENETLLMDAYQLNMSYVYFKEGRKDQRVVFDAFYRTVPEGGSFAVFAGLESIIEYIENMRFSPEDIVYIREYFDFDEDFLEYLANFKFAGSINAVPEGTVIYPNTPIVQVIAPTIHAQLIETALLTYLNHQSLIATKTRRFVHVAKDHPVVEFGARRAHGSGAGVYGARSAYMAGAVSTSNVMAAQKFGMKALGTMAHSFIELYGNEYDAFSAFARTYPNNSIFLIDTYDTVNSGVVEAIRVYEDVLKPMGKTLKGVRLDSGDLAYLSKEVRKKLDAAGLEDTLIYASNSLTETVITDLQMQDAAIDVYCVGENLITSKSSATFGGVYKLVAVEEDGAFIPRIKVSEDVVKIPTPGYKRLFRGYDENGHSVADMMVLQYEDNEKIGFVTDIPFVDSVNHFKGVKHYINTNVVGFKELLVPIYAFGELVYEIPTLDDSRAYLADQLANEVWETEQRLSNPSLHYVNLSEELFKTKISLLKSHN